MQFNHEFDSLLSSLSRLKIDIFLAGDYNIDLLKINSHALTHSFYNILSLHRFIPTILRPTRITQHSATLIDNIFTNVLFDSIDSAILIDDVSDHLPICVTSEAISTIKKNSYSS